MEKINKSDDNNKDDNNEKMTKEKIKVSKLIIEDKCNICGEKTYNDYNEMKRKIETYCSNICHSCGVNMMTEKGDEFTAKMTQLCNNVFRTKETINYVDANYDFN